MHKGGIELDFSKKIKRIPRLSSDIKRAQKLEINRHNFHSKSLKISDFHGNKDRFGTDLGSKTSRIPEHEIWGVIWP